MVILLATIYCSNICIQTVEQLVTSLPKSPHVVCIRMPRAARTPFRWRMGKRMGFPWFDDGTMEIGENRDEQSSPHWQIPVFDGKYRDPTRDGSYTTSRFLSPRMAYPSLCLFHGNNTEIRPLMSLHYLADQQNKNRGCESTNILRVHRPRWKIIYIYIYICLYVIDIHTYVHVK